MTSTNEDEAYCLGCGRPIFNHYSIDRGFGMGCWKLVDEKTKTAMSAAKAEVARRQFRASRAMTLAE